MKVWEATLDEVWDCSVERSGPNKGILTVINKDGTEILRQEVHLMYGAAFGPDVDDVALWEGTCAEAVDKIDHRPPLAKPD